MKITKKQLADCLYTPTTRDDLDRLNSDARKALLAGTLEIEGYERVPAWIKFDPNDERTFPPKNTVVLVMICKELSDGASKKMSVEVFNEYHMPNWLGGTFTHWLPLPKPPQETEEGK